MPRVQEVPLGAGADVRPDNLRTTVQKVRETRLRSLGISEPLVRLKLALVGLPQRLGRHLEVTGVSTIRNRVVRLRMQGQAVGGRGRNVAIPVRVGRAVDTTNSTRALDQRRQTTHRLTAGLGTVIGEQRRLQLLRIRHLSVVDLRLQQVDDRTVATVLGLLHARHRDEDRRLLPLVLGSRNQFLTVNGDQLIIVRIPLERTVLGVLDREHSGRTALLVQLGSVLQPVKRSRALEDVVDGLAAVGEVPLEGSCDNVVERRVGHDSLLSVND